MRAAGNTGTGVKHAVLRVYAALAFPLIMLTATGCAFDPNGFGPVASGGNDGGGGSVDGQITFMRDGAPPDGPALVQDSGPPPVDARVADAAPPACNGDGPTCDGDYAAVCSGGRLTRMRLCPEASFCLFGECAIPFGSSGCSSDASCTSGGSGGSGVCTPFVQHNLNPFDPTTVTLRCATPRAAAGTGAAGAACTSATDCRSGICGRSRCWGVCGNGNQCANPTQCMMAALQVDGVTDDVTGCFAP